MMVLARVVWYLVCGIAFLAAFMGGVLAGMEELAAYLRFGFEWGSLGRWLGRLEVIVFASIAWFFLYSSLYEPRVRRLLGKKRP
jgi:hypothetical protein